jgi:hypothetical protein
MEAIPVEALPKTFRDAIEIARELGIEYLWVDALCIVQDNIQDVSYLKVPEFLQCSCQRNGFKEDGSYRCHVSNCLLFFTSVVTQNFLSAASSELTSTLQSSGHQNNKHELHIRRLLH